jgi:hypothetical protein
MRRAALAALTLAASAGIPATAQTMAPEAAVLTPERKEVTPGAVLTARISQSIEADSNYNLDDPSPGTSYYGDTRAALDYLRESSTQTLGLGIDVGVRPLWEADQDFEVVVASPSSAYLTFGQEGPNTAFNADLNALTRQIDASTASFVDTNGDLVPDTLEQGQRDTRSQRYNANIDFTLGTSSPSTYEFRLLATSLNYTNDAGTDLVPNDRLEGQALWTLDITPVFSTALFGGYTYYTAEDDINSELNIAEAEAGLVYQPDENLRIRGGIGYADRHREGDDLTTGERHTIQDNQGVTLRGDLRYVLPSFTLFGNARWTTAAPSERLTGALVGTYNLPRGQVRGRVFQNFVGGRGGDEEKVTGASIGLSRDINTISRVGLDFAYATQVNQDNPDEPDIDRTDVTLSYGYDFTEAVTAEVGYTFRNRIEDPQDATSNRFYFVIGRDFVTGL